MTDMTFQRNNCNIIIPKFGTTTAEDVNSAVIRLKAKRLDLVAMDMMSVNYLCHTMDGEGLLPDIQVIECTPRDDIQDEAWYRLELFNFVGGDEKTLGKSIYYHPNIIPLDLCQTILLAAIPPAGENDDLPKALRPLLDTETLARIETEKLPYISMPNKWWTEEDNINTYNDWYCAWHNQDHLYLKDLFDVDPTAVQEQYGTNVQGFIEDNLKGIIIPAGCGHFGKYYINDKTSNDSLNSDWKENVACFFPAEWTVTHNTEDMTADYLSYGHEWRTISPLVRFLYADTNNGAEIPKSDTYFRTWWIGS
jgi:hypothetical protein|tara:strand:+ start:591 stop:1514 length:924 start_codon:yes stop_codon:yes gene_type:complete